MHTATISTMLAKARQHISTHIPHTVVRHGGGRVMIRTCFATVKPVDPRVIRSTITVTIEAVVGRRTLNKPLSIMENPDNPLHHTLGRQQSSDSDSCVVIGTAAGIFFSASCHKAVQHIISDSTLDSRLYYSTLYMTHTVNALFHIDI